MIPTDTLPVRHRFDTSLRHAKEILGTGGYAGPRRKGRCMTDPLLPPAAQAVPVPGRRRILGYCASLPLSGGLGARLLAPAAVRLKPLSGVAQPHPALPHGATLLIGGPPGGATQRWAGLVAPALTRGLPPGSRIALDSVGGLDGVTAANRFAAAPAPDGSRLLFTPGAAIQAWLVGDKRARFDVGTWVPVLAAEAPGVLMTRVPLARLRAGLAVRVAVDRLPGPDLAALLAVHLLGAPPLPVFGLPRAAAEAALRRGAVDVILLTGPGVAARVARLERAGLKPLASFGMSDVGGQLQRDPMFPSLPHLGALSVQDQGGLFAAWRASALAAQLVFATTLPSLTPAALISLWRGAAGAAMGDPGLTAALSADGVRPLVGPAALTAERQLAVPAPVLLALRQWLSQRRGWHSG